jgi:hypothetical protein
MHVITKNIQKTRSFGLKYAPLVKLPGFVPTPSNSNWRCVSVHFPKKIIFRIKYSKKEKKQKTNEQSKTKTICINLHTQYHIALAPISMIYQTENIERICNRDLVQLSPLLECDPTVCLPEKSKVTPEHARGWLKFSLGDKPSGHTPTRVIIGILYRIFLHQTPSNRIPAALR